MKIQLGLICTRGMPGMVRGVQRNERRAEGARGKPTCRKLVGKEEPATNHRSKGGGCLKTAHCGADAVKSRTWHLGMPIFMGMGASGDPGGQHVGEPGQWRHPAMAGARVSGREGKTQEDCGVRRRHPELAKGTKEGLDIRRRGVRKGQETMWGPHRLRHVYIGKSMQCKTFSAQ